MTRPLDGPPPGAPVARPTTGAQLVLAWALVGAPLAWGVYQVCLRSLDLFRR